MTDAPPVSADCRSIRATLSWSGDRSGAAKPASGAATTGRGGIITVSNTPCARSPSITVDDTPAAWARPDRVQAKPSFDASITRLRAAVMRSGSLPVRFSPSVQGSGSKAAGARRSIFATMPGGDSV